MWQKTYKKRLNGLTLAAFARIKSRHHVGKPEGQQQVPQNLARHVYRMYSNTPATLFRSPGAVLLHF